MDNSNSSILELGGLRAECFPDSIVLKWEPFSVSGAEENPVSYQVYYKDNGSLDNNWIPLSCEGNGTYTLTELKPDTEYAIFVRAYNDSGVVGSYPVEDEYMTVRTTAAPVIPETPPPPSKDPKDWKKVAIIAGSCLAAALLGILLYFLLRDSKPPVIDNPALTSSVKDYEVTLTWNPATDDVTEPSDIRYRITGTNEAGDWTETREVQGNTITFTDLKALTEYHFRVEAIDKAGNCSPYEDLTTSTTDTEAPTVDDMTVRADNITHESFVISWNPAKDNATPPNKILYRVYLKTEFEMAFSLIKSGFGITSCTASNLYDDRNYMFYVEAYDESGNMLTYERDLYGSFYATTLMRK